MSDDITTSTKSVFAPARDLTLSLPADERDEDGVGITIGQARGLMDDLELDREHRYTKLAEDVEHDNLRRARWGWNALAGYADDTNGLPDVEPLRQMFSDLLGDLMHLADAFGLDFEALVDKGRYHYEPEIRGEL